VTFLYVATTGEQPPDADHHQQPGAITMIEIVRGAEVDGPKGEAGPRRHGMWAYHAPAYPEVCGYSRQPLLDACRQIKRVLGPTSAYAGLFREGRDTPDISCAVEAGAMLTVKEPSGGNIRFGKYEPYCATADKAA
jgi:hypothetical protein